MNNILDKDSLAAVLLLSIDYSSLGRVQWTADRLRLVCKRWRKAIEANKETIIKRAGGRKKYMMINYEPSNKQILFWAEYASDGHVVHDQLSGDIFDDEAGIFSKSCMSFTQHYALIIFNGVSTIYGCRMSIIAVFDFEISSILIEVDGMVYLLARLETGFSLLSPDEYIDFISVLLPLPECYANRDGVLLYEDDCYAFVEYGSKQKHYIEDIDVEVIADVVATDNMFILTTFGKHHIYISTKDCDIKKRKHKSKGQVTSYGNMIAIDKTLFDADMKKVHCFEHCIRHMFQWKGQCMIIC